MPSFHRGEDLAFHHGAQAVGADLAHALAPSLPAFCTQQRDAVKTEALLWGGSGRDREEHDEIGRKGTSL